MTSQEKKLIDNIYKKFQTTMIGAIARFEDNFGYLWDNDSKEADRFADIWEYTRNSILNNGNKQARAAIEDINDFFQSTKYNIQNKYNYKIIFDDNQGDKK